MTSDEDEWSDAADAFDMLDMLVYLLQGVEFIFNKHKTRIAEDILKVGKQPMSLLRNYFSLRTSPLFEW